VIIFTHGLKADNIDIDTPEQAKKFSEEFKVVIRNTDSKYSQCHNVIADFPSIRSNIGIQSVQLLTYEANGKISTQIRVHSSPPPRNPPTPGDKMPKLTEKSRNRTYLCLPKEQISQSQVVITYGAQNAICYKDRVTLHLHAFLAKDSLNF